MFSFDEFLDCFVVDEDVRKLFQKKNIIVFGAGEDGHYFADEFKDIVKIDFFVDNNVDKCEFNNLDVFSIDNMTKVRINQYIIITSTKYYREMAEQLDDLSFAPKKDFFIFDRYCKRYEHCFYKHNMDVWKRNSSSEKRPNKILIPYANYGPAKKIMFSYCANYLSEQYDAEILAVPYINPFSTKENINDKNLRDIYQSFNANELIFDNQLTDQQKVESERFLNEIWPDLASEDDWLHITYKGVLYGKQIIRDFYRYEMPTFDMHDEISKEYLRSMLRRIIFWHDFFSSDKTVKAMIVEDGIYREGLMAHAAIAAGVRVYTIGYSMSIRLEQDLCWCDVYKEYNRFFDELTLKEQRDGLKWAQERLYKRLHGDVTDIPYMKGINPYESKKVNSCVKKSDRTKILICPHSFSDDLYANGKPLFSSVWTWLCHLGDLSRQTNYDWYLKQHPVANKRDKKIIEKFLERFPNIKSVPPLTSPYQLKEEGIEYALTVWGTLGHEYPALGIQVINAGENMHSSFDFDWNPRSRSEYDDCILNITNLHKRLDINEIYKFYCIHFKYYDNHIATPFEYFFQSKVLLDMLATDKHYDCVFYKIFLNECTPQRHQTIKDNMSIFFDWMENYRKDIFYRKRNFIGNKFEV